MELLSELELGFDRGSDSRRDWQEEPLDQAHRSEIVAIVEQRCILDSRLDYMVRYLELDQERSVLPAEVHASVLR